MSFGPSQAQKNATNTQNGITNTATTNSTNELGQGTNLLGVGQGNTNTGTNYLNTILNGNSANTSALLAPSIDQTRQANQQNIQQLSTLQPRGGGRSGTLFNASYAPAAGIQNMFNSTRSTAATALPQIGLQQEGLGTNLFNTGNSALNTGGNTNSSVLSALQQQQNATNSTAGALGSGLFGLATTPLGIGGATGGAGSGLGALIKMLGGL